MKNITASRDFFLHIFTTILLYMGVVSLLSLLFVIINKYIPDAVETLSDYYYEEGIREQARFAIAMLVVTTPIFYWCMRFISKTLKVSPELKNFTPRKWLMYLTIFLAALIVVITLITVVWSFLNGETTLRFFLKVFTVLVIAAGMLWYYLNEVRDEYADHKKYIGWGSLVLIILSIVGGFFVMGSPAEQRSRRIDQERLSNIQDIYWAINRYAEEENGLPESLEELNMYKNNITDPITNKPYVYRIDESTGGYVLCGTFETGTAEDQNKRYPIAKEYIDWSHRSGEHCYTLKTEAQITTVPTQVK